MFISGSISSQFTPTQKVVWEQAKEQALAKCKKLGLPDSLILCALARYLKSTNFQVTLAIQKIMEYNFWINSITSAEDMTRFYPISKEYVDPQVIKPFQHM